MEALPAILPVQYYLAGETIAICLGTFRVPDTLQMELSSPSPLTISIQSSDVGGPFRPWAGPLSTNAKLVCVPTVANQQLDRSST